MVPDAGHVAGKAVASLEVGLVVGERFGDGDGLAALDGAACERPRLVLCLPKRQDALAVGVLVVVGNPRQILGPVAALAVGDADDPRAAVLAAPVGERDTGCDGGEVM